MNLKNIKASPKKSCQLVPIPGSQNKSVNDQQTNFKTCTFPLWSSNGILFLLSFLFNQDNKSLEIKNLIQPDDQQFKNLHVPAAMCSSDDHDSQVGMLFFWSHKDLLINLDITNMITYILMLKKDLKHKQNLVTINEELLPTLHLNDWTHITGRYLSDFTASSAATNGLIKLLLILNHNSSTDLDYRALLKNVSLS